MSKKGFTLIELLAVIILIGTLSAVAISSYSTYLTKSKNKTFSLEEKNFIDATISAYADCSSNLNNQGQFCENHSNNDKDEVKLRELIESGYINTIRDPYNTNYDCDAENSYVKVSVKNSDLINADIEYKVCLICGNHKSDGCLNN